MTRAEMADARTEEARALVAEVVDGVTRRLDEWAAAHADELPNAASRDQLRMALRTWVGAEILEATGVPILEVKMTVVGHNGSR